LASVYDEYVIHWASELFRSKPKQSWLLSEILSSSGCSRKTVFSRLKLLEEKGLIKKFLDKKPEVARVGRPCTIYYPSKSLLSLRPAESLSQIVAIPATKLKSLCRHEKDGFCKERRAPCQPTQCPHIINR